MDQQTINTNQLFGFLPTDVEGVDTLVGLALDMRWSWNHAADELWRQLDSALWDQTHNAWVVLLTVSREQLQNRLAEPAFREKMNVLLEEKQQAANSPAWFQQKYPGSPLQTVAYFSMEFMLSEALPIYVGGLGNVAGDQLKSASDLGIPVIGVGLLYQRGYFRQYIDEYGNQQAYKPYNDPGQLPVTPLRMPNGEWLRVEIPLRGRPLWLRAPRLSSRQPRFCAALRSSKESTSGGLGCPARLRTPSHAACTRRARR